ncbi:3-isopropylmalate dehydratase [Pandoraea nosoerga]|uniref:3-isopropylmalate dehydratase n=1 Tax=Pandoraea nosoerga TaxID=2508296 RepID=A0A5E4X0E8_9BURK|nr:MULTISPECIES: 3-isopropylmalate dehydratase [Pandoraea]MBN4667027.1 3-isopropylmalate dehydratase [Pandoraea nosoerga]MBN4676414.1 3-isopropylmalate dehydratase [Pandoraea nosoerga]MBN4681452.1 3-isopropylmalate dehydratase [Pandoraea nosoerga]MBN4746135.1 3-isopropylmalate dehydratase [Pandoraea nosoerga]VVE29738.1 3-isopropylmalate dehydratase [Pandoraea nosoerga]
MTLPRSTPAFAAPAHRAWVVGADIDTDALAPGAYMKFGIDEIARHCLHRVRPEFAAGVAPGDVLVAGPNFGIGSSREQAAAALVHLGVRAVIAPSFNGLYFRNAFNVGLLLLTCAEAHRIAEGEAVRLAPREGFIERADGTRLACENVPGFLLDMVEAGGLLNLLKRRSSTSHATPNGVSSC